MNLECYIFIAFFKGVGRFTFCFIFLNSYLNMFDIQQKVALITGGASGIGLEVAKQLLANGAKGVVLADINLDAGKKACEELGDEFGKDRIDFVKTDISNKDSFEDAFKFTLEKFENIDILMNNAGCNDEMNYEKTIAVNVLGTIHGTLLAHEKYILNHKSGSEGVIINTASTTGCHVKPVCKFVYGTPIYGATKSAVVSLVIGLGHKHHYDYSNIKVLGIAPGGTLTNLAQNVQPRNEHYGMILYQEAPKQIMQTPEIVARNVIDIIKEKPTGTIWICENNQEAYEYKPSQAIEECQEKTADEDKRPLI